MANNGHCAGGAQAYAKRSLTLITICLNSVKTLRRTVESVLSQECLPNEYLFVDGGSSDGTLELLTELTKALQKAGVRTAVLTQRHEKGAAGIPEAWNQGLAAAQGEFIGLLNSDDWFDPTALSEVQKLAAAHPEAGLLSLPVRFVLPGGKQVKVFHAKSPWLMPWLMAVPHPGLFVSRGVYERIGVYDVHYRISADYDFAWRCLRGGVRWISAELPHVNMELGGLANSNRALARRETREIALRHGWDKITPWLAWLVRTATGR